MPSFLNSVPNNQKKKEEIQLPCSPPKNSIPLPHLASSSSPSSSPSKTVVPLKSNSNSSSSSVQRNSPHAFLSDPSKPKLTSSASSSSLSSRPHSKTVGGSYGREVNNNQVQIKASSISPPMKSSFASPSNSKPTGLAPKNVSNEGGIDLPSSSNSIPARPHSKTSVTPSSNVQNSTTVSIKNAEEAAPRKNSLLKSISLSASSLSSATGRSIANSFKSNQKNPNESQLPQSTPNASSNSNRNVSFSVSETNEEPKKNTNATQPIHKSESFTGRPVWALPKGPVGQRPPTKLPIARPNKTPYPATMERPARPPRPVVKALCDFTATVEEELTLKTDDSVVLKETDENGWGRGFLENDEKKKEGWFPLKRVSCVNERASLMIEEKMMKNTVEERSMVNESMILILEKKLADRPPIQTLQQNNILAKTSASPALQNSTQLLDKSQKGDFLTNFFRRAQAPPGCPLKVSRTNLQLNEIEVGSTIVETIEITSNIKTKFSFEYGPGASSTIPTNIHISFDPPRGILQKNKAIPIKISFLLKSSTSLTNVEIPLFEGEAPKTTQTPIHFSFICKKGVYGSDPSTLPQSLDTEYGLKVPSVLVSLKEQLKSVGDGMKREGIFRVSGESNTILNAKRAINDNKPIGNLDVHTIANLIKLWFREMPTGILQSLSPEQLECENPEECLKSLSSLNEHQTTLLEWVIKLIREIIQHVDTNKMTLDNMSIVFAPNMYKITELDPMKGLSVTQNLAKFFTIIVSSYNSESISPIQITPKSQPQHIPVKTSSPPSEEKTTSNPSRNERRSPKNQEIDLPGSVSVRPSIPIPDPLPDQEQQLDEVLRSPPPNRPLPPNRPVTPSKPSVPSILHRPQLSSK
eukprot:TRINITY_DN4064_c0_g4_i1.p1 TRINITY_DN4064_c0_g4~~TRINITY_DN4064_c0_g4_i1.p1  ORF type:complete len:866 (+),score=342.87 TRINITY_DN4064_c0_g4_i1:173-2770(+)